MRSNKLRLAALAMSFVMAASAVPSVAFAGDLFTSGDVSEEAVFDDGAAYVEQPVDEYIEEPAQVGESLPVEEPVEEFDAIDQVGDDNPSVVLEKRDVRFFYNEAGHDDYTVQYSPRSSETGDPLEGTPFDLKDSNGNFVKANVSNSYPATCEVGESFTLTVNIPGYGTYTSELFYKDGDMETGALGHDWGEVVTRYEPAAICIQNGVSFPDQKCTRCQEWRTEKDPNYNPEVKNVVAIGHQVDESKPTYTGYEPVNNCVLDAEGNPKADDPKKDWSYDFVTYGTCKICGEEDVAVASERVKVPGKPEADVPYISNIEHILNADELEYDATTSNNLTIKDEKVILEDCYKDGSYDVVVDHVDATTQRVVTTILKSYTIHATHHVAEFVEFYKADGRTLLAEVYVLNDENDVTADMFPEALNEGLSIVRKDGEFIVTSLSCKDPYTYVKKVLCYNEDRNGRPHVISNTTETAPAAGPHIIDVEVRDAVKEQYIDSDTRLRVRTYDELEELVGDYNVNVAPKDGDNPYVDLVLGTASCTNVGTVKVQYRCYTCDKQIEEQTVSLTEAIGHKKAEPVAENYVAPTCTKTGSFDSVTYCKICGNVISSKKVTVPEAGHKFLTETKGSDENVILGYKGNLIVGTPFFMEQNPYVAWDDNDEDTQNTYDVLGEYRKVYLLLNDVCTVCGKTQECGEVRGKILSVVPGGNYCEEKQLTVEVGYKRQNGDKAYLKETYTFPYYEDVAEWSGRTPHQPGKVEYVDEVPATATTPGSKVAVVYCSLCNREIGRETVEIPYEIPELTKVEAKEATCTEDGNIEYYYFEEDGKTYYFSDKDGKEQIPEEVIPVKALGHDIQKVEAKEPTATEEGNIEHYACTRCGKLYADAEGTKELTKEEVIIPKKELPAKVTGVKTNMYPSDLYPSKGYMKVSWSAVDDADDYRLSYRALGASAWTKVLTGGATTYTLKEDAIKVGTSYEIRVAAGKNGVFGPRSTVIRRYYESVKPSFTKAANSIAVSWNAVPKGSSYMVIYSENKSMKPYKTIIVRNGILTATLRNLKAGTKYYIRVRPYDKTSKTATGALSPLKCVTTSKK